MRKAKLLIGTLGIVACSLDHVRVAALDDAGSENPGAVPASAGNSSLSTSTSTSAGAGAGASASASASAGAINWGGAPPQDAKDRFILISAGSNVELLIGGDAGAPSEVACSCLASGQVRLCGSDGITYPASCDDAGTCLLPAIACIHACPCLDGESANPTGTTWFSLDCISTARCENGLICATFSNTTPDGPSSCADAGI